MDREQLYLDRLRKALRAIQTLKARVADLEGHRGPTALVGMACRLPGGVDSPESYWDLLCSDRDAIGPVPPDRWDASAWHDPDPATPGRTPVREGGFLDDVASFDAALFGIAPREAAVLDPQQRLLLETTWEALERAAIAPDSLSGTRTGIFVGISTADHRKLLERRPPEDIDPWMGTGNVASTAAGRLAYVLGTQGPAIALDTACSSSLVAVHLAARALADGECDLAIAAGVNVLLDPEGLVYFSKLGALSPGARCRSFSADADGYVRSEGCGVVVLRRLADAGDGPVVALLRGSAVNQDGRSNGLTAPSGPAQTRVVRDALSRAGARPADVVHVECHATGTPLGDPIEVEALAAALDGAGDVILGAAKSRIGHLEAAAGVAGLIKAALTLQHGTVPPNLHLGTPNPHLDWSSLPFVLPTTSAPLPDGLVGVSSFGFSGTNAHLVLERAPARPMRGTPDGPLSLALSAHTTDALRALAGRWADALTDRPGSAADLCHTAITGRARLRETLVVTGTLESLCTGLQSVAAGGEIPAGPWPDPTEGQPTLGPTMPFARTRFWSVEPLRPDRRAAGDPLAGRRWQIIWEPVATEPTSADPPSAVAAAAAERDPPPVVLHAADPAEVARLRALASAHPRVTVTVVRGPSPVVADHEDHISWRDGAWHAPRLRAAPRGPTGRLDGQVVATTIPQLAEAARMLGAARVQEVIEGAHVVICDRPVETDAAVVLVVGIEDWLGDEPAAALRTATAIAWAEAREAPILRWALGGGGLDRLDAAARQAALAEALGGGVWAMGFDLRRWRQTWPARADRPLLRGLDTTRPTTRTVSPGTLPAVVDAAVRAALGLQHVPVDEPLATLGMDSVMALDLRNRLEEATGLQLPATLPFDHPTASKLVRELGRRLGRTAPTETEAAVDALSEEEAEAALAAALDQIGSRGRRPR